MALTTIGIGDGEFSYNGISFPGANNIKAKIVPVRDEANRVAIGQKVTLTVSGVLQSNPEAGVPNTDLDASIQDIRHRLMQSGKRLAFSGKGLGNIDNFRIGRADIQNGPHPESFDWEPIGGTRACSFVYVISTIIPIGCGSANASHANGAFQVGIVAFNSEIDFSYNDGGYCTRTIAGYLQISQTTDGSKETYDIDSYREQLRVPILPNFLRNQTFNISSDRSRITFTITDSEIESRNAYPVGVRKIEANHRVSWQRSNKQGMTLRNNISAEIELLPLQPAEKSLLIFLDMIFNRITSAKKKGYGILLDSLEVNESIYSRQSSFSAGYRILRGLKDFLDSGLWKPMGDDWNRWKVSLAAARDVRGHSQLRFSPDEDAVISLCDQRGVLFHDNLKPEPTQKPSKAPKIENEKPPEKYSYLEYEQTIVPELVTPTYRQRTLQAPYPNAPQGSIDMLEKAFNLGTGSGTPDTIQQSGRTSVNVTLKGRAVRAGYDVPRPKLEKFGNQVPVETDAIFQSGILAVVFGVPVHEARWLITYMVPQLPGTVTTPPNVEQNQ